MVFSAELKADHFLSRFLVRWLLLPVLTQLTALNVSNSVSSTCPGPLMRRREHCSKRRSGRNHYKLL
jgi:hypothetical protein